MSEFKTTTKFMKGGAVNKIKLQNEQNSIY